ncbi:hypothetical protein FIBSPDRAFT_269483 [Athelia psychrophila]|uniref:MYND-type domain-containing protein n=1 Tax=Athelia psychrophila TaxID=1759441 RepID=A0A165X407_9AGAM|nr:hypothetical protein FIBSPDRAFT_269483 [Fibularhizoctonia sp. CBS 109695]
MNQNRIPGLNPNVLILALTGWRKSMSPYTHPVDLSTSPCDLLLRYASLLLSSMTTAVEASDRQQADYTSTQIASMWPSMWIWLQILHSRRSHPASNKDAISPIYLYNVVKRFLFTAHTNSPTRLSALIMGQKEAMEMMASAWIEEGSDMYATHGFQASVLTTPLPSGASWNFMPYIVDRCGGDADDVVRILFCRIKYNAKQAETDWRSLRHDMEVIKYQIYPCKDAEPQILRQALLFHPAFPSAMVDVLSRLLNKPKMTVELEVALTFPLLMISRHLDIRGYDCIVQLMNTTFLALIARLPRTLGSNRDIDGKIGEIFQILGRFLVYRALLGKVERNMDLALGEGEATYRKGGGQNLTGKGILALKDQCVQWAHLYNNDYKMFASKYKTDCGYPLCSQNDSDHTFRRCSGCRFVQYCTKSCQRKHWRGQHKTLCAEMRSSGREPVGLSGPGLRFITHVVAHDCMGLDLEQRNAFKFEQGNSIQFETPARKFMLLISYANAPEEDRVYVETMYLPHFDETNAATNMPGVGIKLTNAWHAAWAHAHLRLSEHLLCVLPIFVLLPGDLGCAQVMTAFFTLHRRTGQSREEPHIRWLHRM